MSDNGLFFSYEGRKERRTGEIRGAFSRMQLVIANGSVEFCEATPIGLVDEPKVYPCVYPCTGARPTETCVAPVDATRDFIYFLRTRSVGGGGGGMLPDFFFCSLFPVQQTTSGIGHRVK